MRSKEWALQVFPVKGTRHGSKCRIRTIVNNPALFGAAVANSLTTQITNVGLGSRLKQGRGNQFPCVSRWDLCSRLWFRPTTNLASGAHGIEHTLYDLLGASPMGDVWRFRFE